MSRAGGEVEFEFLDDGSDTGNFVATGKVVPMLTTLLAKGSVEEAMHLYEGSDASVAGELLAQAKTMSSASLKNLGAMFQLARDFSSAAKVFESGKQYADAAKMYEQGCDYVSAARNYGLAGELPKAAAALERAGKPDLALDIYQKLGPSEAMAECMVRQHLYWDAAKVFQYAGQRARRGGVVAAGAGELTQPHPRGEAARRPARAVRPHGAGGAAVGGDPAAGAGRAERRRAVDDADPPPGDDGQARPRREGARLRAAAARLGHGGVVGRADSGGGRHADARARRAPRTPTRSARGSLGGPSPSAPPPRRRARPRRRPRRRAPPRRRRPRPTRSARLVDPFAGGAPAPSTSAPAAPAAPAVTGMPVNDGYGQLKAIPIFGELALPDMKDLYRISEAITYAPGFTVIEQGVQGQGLIVILQGSIQVVRVDGGQDDAAGDPRALRLRRRAVLGGRRADQRAGGGADGGQGPGHLRGSASSSTCTRTSRRRPASTCCSRERWRNG